MIGSTISHYRIVEALGTGGMGVVYKAVDVRLNRFVALKFLSPELTRDADANLRFRQEAQAASALDHPNICTIHEIDETPDRKLFLTMAYYEGETLKRRIERGPLSIEEVLAIAIQVCDGLSRAHQAHIVHRDIKPANIIIAKDGAVKILDFGLAKLAGGSDLTRTGTTLGTVAYMAPEQVRGGNVDTRADVWSVGIVIYEMLAGRRPFQGKDDFAVLASILDDTPTPIGALRPGLPRQLEGIIARALSKHADTRYASATELLNDLTACRTDVTGGAAARSEILRLLRRPATAIPAAGLLLALGVAGVTIYVRTANARWARQQAIPEITRLVAADNYAAAFSVAKQAERYIPSDPMLAGLWPQFSVTDSMTTDPDGADVYVQDYAVPSDKWDYLGRTPLKSFRLPRGAFRFRIEKAGYEPQMLASKNPGPLLTTPMTVLLPPNGASPEMVPVPGGAYPVGLNGFNYEAPVAVDPFSIDRFEVTNKAFKQFVDSGGYTNQGYWRGLSFLRDGRELPWQEALSQFRDSTGRPGPATWELGEYPASQADFPVGGVSWYEAIAYCRAQRKELPTIFHWARAGLSPIEISNPLAPSIIPVSNFGAKGPVSVGAFRGLGPYGTFDMAGNVREWVWNEAPGGRRFILGGAWNDPDYTFVVPTSLPPLDRSATNGLRCARYASERALPDALLDRVDTNPRDNWTAKAVSDEVFEVFKRQLSLVKSPLNARVDAGDESAASWTRETFSFDAGYESGRVTAHVFLPRAGRPPYQVVVYFPGIGSFVGRASSANLQPANLSPTSPDYIVRSGRAFVWPIYKGSYERWDPFLTLQGEEYLSTFRTRMFQWRQDLGRVLDVLTQRDDIDSQRIAFLGQSFGGSTAFPLVALEDRIKVAVLAPSGFTYRQLPPEADAINYLSRVKMPILMVGGGHDYIFPLESSQKPMFARLATPNDQKRQVVFDCGHNDFPRSEFIREVLGWLDRYLGPVRSSTPTSSP